MMMGSIANSLSSTLYYFLVIVKLYLSLIVLRWDPNSFTFNKLLETHAKLRRLRRTDFMGLHRTQPELAHPKPTMVLSGLESH